MATSAPGQSSVRPKNKAPLAETLKLNGYATAQFGKCHEVPAWDEPDGSIPSVADRVRVRVLLRLHRGEANQWFPGPFEGTSSVEPPKTPEEGYHLTEDLADHAVSWIRQQKSLMPDKPFFIYFAPGATHAPHHVPADWVERNRGRFDAGWDAQRQETFARQKELDVIPADAELTARPDAIRRGTTWTRS